ncbi:pyocin S6 family toxin immunity protein [Pseudomonas uvaldensis]|uniref:pyocin S6 family toxin immunity protein n=1 Tax=Pseudomonas uvaldensis TaxID=2878385 RepID=UPI001E3558E4|nr:pyocin S6 family toxin immunity protein [Pseudomonas uvaldensis]MCE0461349.1 hypothetical protein [Pseudomonas uvaldensis]
MNICVSGFLADSSVDDSLKFELYLDFSFIEEILKILGHKDINAMAEGEWLLTDEQAMAISKMVGEPIPTDLKLFIGLET